MNNSQIKETAINLTDCDKEKIHQISYVQSHGAFVAISPLDMRIHHTSQNLSSFFGKSQTPDVLLKSKLNEIISLELYTLIKNKIKSTVSRGQRKYSFEYSFLGETIDVFLYHMNNDLIGIEFEKHPTTEKFLDSTSPERLNDFITGMQRCETLDELAKAACRAVRAFSNFDRVMVYRFYPPTMYGEVIGEDKVADSQSFLHHRFPSTDIPKPARDLYSKNEIRFIYDSHETTSDVYPKFDENMKPLDFSESRLRGVSLIHIEYLKNMGVRGSFSVAINVEGKLWGIISCHSLEPVYISHQSRNICLSIANIMALTAPMIEKLQKQKKEILFFSGLQSIFAKLKMSQDPLDHLFRIGESINQLFGCSGFALVSGKKVDLMGLTPRAQDIKKIAEWISLQMNDENKKVFVTDNIAAQNPDFEELKEMVCGLMAVSLDDASDSILIFFRPEYLQTIHWGGDPRKNIEARNYQGTINPRASFETWSEVIKNSSIPWTSFETGGASYFKDLVFDSLVRKEQLISELNQKVLALKN